MIRISRGDNLFGVKTTYKNINMKSKLETKFAYFLDLLFIKWEYEPRQFLLSNGIPYIPDFYLPELKTWIETKGFIEENNKKISERFVRDNQEPLILISDSVVIYYEIWRKEDGGIGSIYSDNNLQIGHCSNCKRYFFSDMIGSFHCRACQYWNGDHDIISLIGESGIEFSFLTIKDIDAFVNGLKNG